MARSMPLTTGIRSAPTTEMYTRCGAPARAAARTRFRALSSSPLLLPAQCTIDLDAVHRGLDPLACGQVTGHVLDAVRGLVGVPAEHPDVAARRRAAARTTRRPSVPVPPVTRMGDVMVPPSISRVVTPPCPLSHRGVRGCQCGDTRQRGNVTDGRQRLAGSRLRGAPRSPAGGGLPAARLDDRRRRRRAGHLAAADRRGHQRGREPRRLADHGRRAGVAEHAPVAPAPARGAGR